MHKIKVPIGIEGSATVKQFSDFCTHFGCTLEPKKRGEAEWTITSEEAVNFLWLGANLNFKYNGGMAQSVSSAILG